MKNRKKDIIYMFIASLAFSALMAAVFIVCEQKSKLYLALIPQLVLALLIGIMYLQEKALNNEAEKLRNRPESEMRQQVLENYETNGCRNIGSSSMSDDLKSIFRRNLCPPCLGFGILCIILTAIVVFTIHLAVEGGLKPGFSGIGFAVLFGISGISGILTAISQFLGLPVTSFMKREKMHIDMIESSYMNGNMICGKLGGINIGTDYCVCYTMGSVIAFRTQDISCVNVHKRIDVRRGRSGFGEKAEKDISVVIRLEKTGKTYKIELSELQLEYVCDEFMRHGVSVRK